MHGAGIDHVCKQRDGIVQPIREIARAISEFKHAHAARGAVSPYPLFHTDAAQAFHFLDCDAAKVCVDLMTLSSHKIYGPKGAGALYIKDTKWCAPLVAGGGQEFGLRSGTENVPAIVGFAEAVTLALAAREVESRRIAELRDELWGGIKKIFPQAELNNVFTKCIPNMLNVYFPGHEAQDLLTKFDLAGLAASSGSACRSRSQKASYVLEALGFSRERAASSIRFSLGRPTTKGEVAEALSIIKSVAE